MSLQGLHLKTENEKRSIPQIEGIWRLLLLWAYGEPSTRSWSVADMPAAET